VIVTADGADLGLPPRARGSPTTLARKRQPRRPTPAGAGITRRGGRRWWSRPAYPRGRGDHLRPAGCGSRRGGLPPRARGSPRHAASRGCRGRPTPAGAGITPIVCACALTLRAYPRGRGDHPTANEFSKDITGLPPRARGSPRPGRAAPPRPRPTPAGAGITLEAPCANTMMAAYPRGRGDHREETRRALLIAGLPPRARGSPLGVEEHVLLVRPTPAGAGITAGSSANSLSSAAYPRGRGDHPGLRTRRVHASGLPPRARGSLIDTAGISSSRADVSPRRLLGADSQVQVGESISF